MGLSQLVALAENFGVIRLVWRLNGQKPGLRSRICYNKIHKIDINVYYVGDASTCNFSVYSEERAL